MDEPIRKLTPEEWERRERIEEEASAAYEQKFGAAIREQYQEYETEFGEGFRAKHPFKPNTTAAHEAAMKAVK